MARKKHDVDDCIVKVYEREFEKGIRFYLHYSVKGEQYREAVKEWRDGDELKEIPLVSKENKLEYTNTKSLVDKIKHERTKEIRAGQLGFKHKTKLRLVDWMRTCADEAKDKSKGTASHHTWEKMLRQTAAALVEYGGKDVKLFDVDKNFVKGFIDWLQHDYVITRTTHRGGVQNEGQHLTPKTAKKKYSCLCYALNKAVQDDKIKLPRNPCDLLDKKKDKIKVNESMRTHLTIEELKMLEATPASSSETRRAYLFMCYCGLRISDVKQLRWSDIDQTSDPWRIAKRQQKTQEPVYEPLADKALELLPARGEAAPSDLVFTDLPAEPVMNRALKVWARRAGIEKNVTLHTARHTYATMLLTLGVDIYTVSKMLGHSNIATTQIYAKIVDSKKVDAVNLLNNL